MFIHTITLGLSFCFGWIGSGLGAPYLLDIVVAKSTAIFELLAGENQALLVGWDAFLVLDFGFDIVDRVGGLDLKSDGLAREGLDEAVIQPSSVFPSSQSLRI